MESHVIDITPHVRASEIRAYAKRYHLDHDGADDQTLCGRVEVHAEARLHELALLRERFDLIKEHAPATQPGIFDPGRVAFDATERMDRALHQAHTAATGEFLSLFGRDF